MKLTKKIVLENELKLWDYLRMNPSKEEEDFDNGIKGFDYNATLLCEYAKHDCDKCLMSKYFNQFISEKELIDFPCNYKNSPYLKYAKSENPKTKKKYANIMFTAVEEIINKSKRER